MKTIMAMGGGLCLSGLIMCAVSGVFMALIIPAGIGALLFSIVGLYNHQLRKQAASWRAKYPPYGY